ncbi:hypothetical protein K469DRAFT_774309 [Zopfia rhizophila CBS 207.26]|uniref:Uncharacterized protein n=1 Tax=Zopfia rhizophila CBS 207.26 TaxID=1314779 RepID=A0A6A6EUH4_9PEZI|nr:hypothetical protein K469DRAFT_774309 [Zopfia rhizophila CBS 207.26]
MARKEGLTSSVIKNGWKAASLVPWNPSKGLESSQLKKTALDALSLFTTPTHEVHIIEAHTALRKAKSLTFETDIVLHKVGRSIGKLQASIAIKDAEIKGLKSRLEELQGQNKRRKIVADPNAMFCGINDIKQALEEQKAAEAARAEKKPEEEAKKAAALMEQAKIDDHVIVFQI